MWPIQMAPSPLTSDLEGHFAAWNLSNYHTSGNVMCIIYSMFQYESESTHGW